MIVRHLVIASLGLLPAILLAGCPDDVLYVPSIPAGCDEQPVFELLSPNPDGTQEFEASETTTMDINLDVGNFTIVDKRGQPAVDCEGHFHVSIDGGSIFMMVTTLLTVDISDLSDGTHTFSLAVHRHDHRRYEDLPVIETTFIYDIETN